MLPPRSRNLSRKRRAREDGGLRRLRGRRRLPDARRHDDLAGPGGPERGQEDCGAVDVGAVGVRRIGDDGDVEERELPLHPSQRPAAAAPPPDDVPVGLGEVLLFLHYL